MASRTPNRIPESTVTPDPVSNAPGDQARSLTANNRTAAAFDAGNRRATGPVNGTAQALMAVAMGGGATNTNPATVQGPPGTAATITVGPTTILPYGSNPTVGNSGTQNAATLNFSLPASLPATVSGDLSGSLPSPSVVALRGVGISASAPSVGNVLQYATSTGWTPTALPTSYPPNGAAGGGLAGTYPNPTIAPTGVTAGTYGTNTAIPQFTTNSAGQITTAANVSISFPVTSVSLSGGTTGLTVSGGTSGAVSQTLAGTLAIASGGTGATTASAGLAALGGVPTSRQVIAGNGLGGGGSLTGDITVSLSAPVSIANGGTNATTASAGLTNLGGVATTDSRLSNSRTPTAHASTHGTAGSDPVSLDAGQTATGTFTTGRLGSGTASANTYLAGDSTWKLFPASSTGTVTSVALSAPSFLNVSGSPVTSAGTLALSAANQTANTLLAGPSSGTTAAAPTFRALVPADIPALDASILTTGTIPPARLGSGTANATTFLTGASSYVTAVTSVNVSFPGAIYTIANTQTGGAASATASLNPQTAGTVFAAPLGISGTPAFRNLAASDLPYTGGLFYSQATVKTAPATGAVTNTSASGDTVNGSTTKTYFASQAPFPANFLTAGMVLHLIGSGLYSTSGTAGVGALAPAATPIVSFVSAGGTVVDAVTSAALQNPAGAANLGFSFDCLFTVRSVGVNGKITADGTLRFQAASGAALITVVPTVTITVDTTQKQIGVLSVTMANNTAGNTFTIMSIRWDANPAAALSN